MDRSLLELVGERVRRRRETLGLTQRELAERAGLSLRFLAQLEHGSGNISLARFADVAHALGMSPAALLEVDAATTEEGPLIALLGLRGAGKTTIGRRLAARLDLPFVELDELVVEEAGLSLEEIFELHGEAYYRRIEREALRRFLDSTPAGVLATGGSIVTDPDTYRLLRERALTIWLRARPRDHWNRVVEQGDRRPMAENPQAYAELCALLAAREPLYATAHHVLDTTRRSVDGVVSALESLVTE